MEVVSLGHAAALLEATAGPFAVLELEWNKVRGVGGGAEGGEGPFAVLELE